MTKQKGLKTGEKVMFGFAAIFVLLAVIAYIVLESVRLNADEPMFETKTHYEFSEEGHRGSALFRTSRCTSCHRALRNGTNMGLSLDGLGSLRSREWILAFLLDPEKNYGAPTVDHGLTPKEGAYVAKLPKETLHAIAEFLSSLKSDQGSSTSPLPPKGRSEFIDGMVKMWAPEEWNEKYTDIREKDQAQPVVEKPAQGDK
jgi:hypothetical protein